MEALSINIFSQLFDKLSWKHRVYQKNFDTIMNEIFTIRIMFKNIF